MMMRKITRMYLDEWLSRYATKDQVLDIGAGPVKNDPLFPNRFTVDISPEYSPDIIADIHALPIADDSFDMIVCREVLEHCYDPQQAIHELMRVLKPGGLLVLTTRFLFPLHDAPGDYWRYTPYALKRLFSNWTIIDLHAETKPFSCIAVLLQRIELQTVLRWNKPVKFLLRGMTYIFSHLDGLILSSYGDIKKERSEQIVMSSGLYIAVRKISALNLS